MTALLDASCILFGGFNAQLSICICVHAPESLLIEKVAVSCVNP